MSACASECDCGWPGPDYGPHDPDCHWWVKCDEGHMCDLHEAQAMAEHAYLRGVPRHAVFDDAAAREERDQELRDAGRGHLCAPFAAAPALAGQLQNCVATFDDLQRVLRLLGRTTLADACAVAADASRDTLAKAGVQ